MKFIKLSVLLFALTAFVSCKKEEPKPTETVESTTIEKETVIVKDTVAPPPPPAEAKGTSVKVNGNGVEVESKDVNVEVKK